ncbi:hypothetical protein GCM10010185_35190 [Saccharothrix coeruleofusca]|uniref:Uncharacterized protein n=1 Tax=Saccharothrix coeruleofusca TaxID=33919 RepID=A0A918EEU2_9PSEU|nr:hypothetical protein GCM10010185_35190 [Saccharothrix coeruleofusca]
MAGRAAARAPLVRGQVLPDGVKWAGNYYPRGAEAGAGWGARSACQGAKARVGVREC